MIKIDKMDQNAAIVPTIWSQLASTLFKEGERVQVSLQGMIAYGTQHTRYHIRTVFEDCKHGSEMQLSTITQNFHEIALKENHLPEELVIGTDNTPKETKNKYFCWWAMWLLCVLADTPLWSIGLVCLLVGHTHDEIDRFFSRVKVALAGKDYFTVTQMLAMVIKGLPGFDINASHLSRVWAWKDFTTAKLPEMRQLQRIHGLNFFRSNGIWVKWKQYMTSEAWSNPVLLISQEEIPRVAMWRPVVHTLRFKEAHKKLAWLDKFEMALVDATWCKDKHSADLKELRDIVKSTADVYKVGSDIEEIIADLKRLGGASPTTVLDDDGALPSDQIVQLFPGALCLNSQTLFELRCLL